MVTAVIFQRHIAKCYQIYNLVGYKDPVEQTKSSSLEIKCRIAKIGVHFMKFDLLTGGQEITELAKIVKF